MPNTGTSKPGRLKRRSDFLRIQQSGRKWVSPTVIVQADKAHGADNRAGITATKKLGNAVARNRVKRRLREAVKQALIDTPVPQDVVLIGRDTTATCDFASLIKDLKWCLKRLEVTRHAARPDTNS